MDAFVASQDLCGCFAPTFIQVPRCFGHRNGQGIVRQIEVPQELWTLYGMEPSDMGMAERDAVRLIFAMEDISLNIEQKVKRRLKEFFFRALNYLAISVFILVVYGSFLLTDYAILGLVAWLLREEVAKYPVVALWFEYARIGLALLLILCAAIHGILSAISQVKWDLAISKEVENI